MASARPVWCGKQTGKTIHPTPPSVPKTGAIKPMITMYAVANIDSALWGTRSIGDVKCTSAGAVTDSDTDTDSDTGNVGGVEATPRRRVNDDGDGGVKMTHFALSRGDDPAAPAAREADEEEKVPHTCPDSDAPGASGGRGGGRKGDEPVTEVHRGQEGGGERKKSRRRGLSLRAWKFIILVPWVLVNVGVTVAYIRWRLYTLALLGFFAQIAGMVVFVVAAWVEARLQRRSALPPKVLPPPADSHFPERQ